MAQAPCQSESLMDCDLVWCMFLISLDRAPYNAKVKSQLTVKCQIPARVAHVRFFCC